MKCALLIIGDEILSGRIQDKNIHWLAKYLFSNGHQLSEVLITKDNIDTIVGCFNKLLDEHDFIFVSGGLGPTEDDVTKGALAKFHGTKLEFDQRAYDIATNGYKRYGREFEDYKKMGNQYDLIPIGVTPLENPVGLAPGLFLKTQKGAIFCAPGVPREYQGMIELNFPSVGDKSSSARKQFTCKSKGIPEEKIFFDLCPTLWKDLSQFGQVSSYPVVGGIDVVVTYEGDKENNIKNIFEKSALKPYIWHYGTQSLEELIITKAKQLGLKLAVAESCTGGLIASKLTNVSGSSEVFLGGVVSYSNEAKMKLLNVEEKTLIDHGAVSEETAKEMALGAKNIFGADLAISTTGIAGPNGGSEKKPVGSVAIGGASKEINSKWLELKGDRIRLKNFFAQHALFHLLELLEECQK